MVSHDMPIIILLLISIQEGAGILVALQAKY